LQANIQNNRIASIDLLRGLVVILMALDHVRMYLGHGTWYAEPTHLATTTPLLFFTRWITHFCAPVFIFLASASAFLYGMRKEKPERRCAGPPAPARLLSGILSTFVRHSTERSRKWQN